MTRRQITTVAAILTTAVVVFLGGAGFYFAGQIYSGAFALDRPAPGVVPARDVYSDPSAFGASFTTESVPCGGGSCPDWFVPAAGTPDDTWAVLVHGRGAGRTEPLRALTALHEAGIPALDISYRNDNDAPEDPSHRYEYGRTEWHDLAAAVDHAQAAGARRILLFGSSMGGAIVAAFLAQAPAAETGLVSGIILDAPMLDLDATIDWQAGERSLPMVGLPIPGVLTGTAKWIADHRYHLGLAGLDHLPGAWLHVPALVFHGTADPTVPIATSDRFTAAHPRLVTEVRVPGAAHVASWNADPKAYDAAVHQFLSRTVGGAAPPTPDPGQVGGAD
ncbi:MAG TPA: alpha/beta hydrolase [Sporichthyaceae bacterium]|nr:alpha/beta hydrolase [Sporichthyaceae bacterium]